MSSLYDSLPPGRELSLMQHAEEVVNAATTPVVDELGKLAVFDVMVIPETSDEELAAEMAGLSADELVKETQSFVNAKHDFDEANATRRRSAENREWLRAKLAERNRENS